MRFRRQLPFFRCLTLCVLVWVSSSASAAEIYSYALKNGLKILVKPDHRAPVVVHQIWYRVGSNYETNGRTGLSHMLEHMMFKGTPKVPEGQFSKTVARLGGQENAFTSSDYTAYYQVVGKDHLETVMKLEADRMRHLNVTDAAFQTERNVVTEERRWRTEDKPSAKLYEQFKAVAFLNSPAHHPVIGWMTDIRHWTLEDVRRWYRQWYAPNNATLVVVGDVDPKRVLKLAKQYYGGYSSVTLPSLKPQTEITQAGERRLTLKGATKLPQLLMGFHVPTLVTAKDNKARQEVYALSVLATILGGDASSRLDTQWVRGNETLLSASAGVDITDRLTTLFQVDATPVKGTSLKEAEAAIWQEIDQLKKTPVTQRELDRVLAQAEAAYVYHQDSLQSQASVLGALVSVGLPVETMKNWVKNLRQVTPEAVQSVAIKYLKPDRVTVGQLLPNGKAPERRPTPNFHAGH